MIKKILICFCWIMLTPSWSMAFTTHTQEIFTNSLCPIPKKAGNKEFYGQFFEDFILSIVFSRVDKGTYIDVGASSPTIDSVTNYFYQRGWTGINIEPLPNKYEELVKARPKDVNLNVGISVATMDNVKFYRIFSKKNPEEDGLSTFDENVLNQAIKKDGCLNVLNQSIKKNGCVYESLSVKVTTLNEVLRSNKISNISFLKIDVEGKEKDVLNSIDLKKYRPQVLLIEATEPRTMVDSSYRWKDILLKNNYVFILFDGLNSYYVAKEYYNNLYVNFLKAYNCAAIANKKYHVLDNKMLFSAYISNQNIY